MHRNIGFLLNIIEKIKNCAVKKFILYIEQVISDFNFRILSKLGLHEKMLCRLFYIKYLVIHIFRSYHNILSH